MDLNEKNSGLRQAVLDRITERLDGVASTLESPIETTMFWALIHRSTEWGSAEPQDLRELGMRSWVRLPGETADEIAVFPQHEIATTKKTYRVDFYLQAKWMAETIGGGREERFEKFVVECDGHEFHERTREQAARDRSRDRDLQASGYAVLRFTGSELFRDPIAAATEVLRAIEVKVQANWSAAFDAAEAAFRQREGK